MSPLPYKWHQSVFHFLLIFGVTGQTPGKDFFLAGDPEKRMIRKTGTRSSVRHGPSASGVPMNRKRAPKYIG